VDPWYAPLVLVTVGTDHHPFDRLVGWIDRWAPPGRVRLVVQYGTAVPPRGLSGLMRRAAYQIPEHYTSHWLMLMAADRVDVIEHGSGRARLLPLVLPVVAAGAVVALSMRARARERRWHRRLFRLFA